MFAPENGWLEDDSFPFGIRRIFRGYSLVLGSVYVWKETSTYKLITNRIIEVINHYNSRERG